MRAFFVLCKEALRELRATITTAATSAALVAGVVLVVSLTYGRAVAAAEEAVAIMDAAGTRTIVVKIDPASHVPVRQLQPLSALSSTAEVLYLQQTRDGFNAAAPGEAVGVRSCLPESSLELCAHDSSVPSAYAGQRTLEQLGFSEDIGLISDGRHTYAARMIDLPLFNDGSVLEGSVLASPTLETDSDSPVTTLIITADVPASVAPTISVIRSLLSNLRTSDYAIDHKLDLIEAGDTIDASLLAASRTQMLLALGVAGVMLALSELSVARARRKFAGLRRALGARRSQLILLSIMVSAMTGLAGVMLGSGVSRLVSLAASIPIAPLSFTFALGSVTLATGVLASLAPALYSSTRQPARELRTP